CAPCACHSQNSMPYSTMSKRRASMPCPLARIRTSQNGAVTSAYYAAGVRRGFLMYQLGEWNLQYDRMKPNALHCALSTTLSPTQANCLRRIARPTGRSLRWYASMPWSSGSTPCCAQSISCNLLCKNSMARSLMNRKSASIGSRRCRDDSLSRGEDSFGFELQGRCSTFASWRARERDPKTFSLAAHNQELVLRHVTFFLQQRTMAFGLPTQLFAGSLWRAARTGHPKWGA